MAALFFSSMAFRNLTCFGLLALSGACALAEPGAPNEAMSPEVREFVGSSLAHRARDTGRPWAVLDKKNARLHLFGTGGTLQASSTVLLGAAVGDDSVPGIGERKMADIRPFEKTTPAGRFLTEPGTNLQGEDIIWVDYDAAISMHRVRALKGERRLERLTTSSPTDNRISYGCINVPAAFYDRWLKPSFGRQAGVVYVLPETRAGQVRFKVMLSHMAQ